MNQESSRTMRRAKWVVIAVAVVLAIGAGRTVLLRMSNAKVLDHTAEDNGKLYVQVAQPQSGANGNTLQLPGSLQGFVQAPISARASGYVKRWTRDIGARVEKGDLLAEIESPEIDQQLTQAEAARAQSAASLGLAKSTMERWEALRKKDVVAQQELDEKQSGYAQAEANLAAASANVERLRQLEGFKRVVAPFAGIVTRRNVDVGDLIEGTAGRPLFILTQTDPLRVYVNVPQTYAQLVKPGQKVTVTQAELRGQAYEGRVERTAGAIDAGTRTMQVEISLPNRDGTLLPGAFVQVALPLQGGTEVLISTNALIFRKDGLSVAAVQPDNRVHLLPVKVGRNYGDRVQVASGLKGDERLVLNPPDSITEGDTVTVVKREAKG